MTGVCPSSHLILCYRYSISVFRHINNVSSSSSYISNVGHNGMIINPMRRKSSSVTNIQARLSRIDEFSAKPKESRGDNESKHSGLQLKVFSLYRDLLRASRNKDMEATRMTSRDVGTIIPGSGNAHGETKPSFLQLYQRQESNTFHVRQKFRSDSEKLNRREIDRIEHQIRQGQKYIKLLQMKGVSAILER